MATVLLAEDEAPLRDLIQLWLERASYTCLAVGSGRDALRLFYSAHPDLVLLDLALPEMDGWQLCERIREVSQVPVIMLTAQGDEPSKVRGLQMGADDYVTKPFGFPELLARVHAVLRRAPTGPQHGQVYREGELLLDPQAHRAMLNGENLKLTPTEYRLLAFLMQHSGQLLTHRQILDGVWGHAYENDNDSLRIYIRSLRRKLEGEQGTSYIATEHGLGYRFRKSSPD
ncbi:MAG: response regulator transcription factor [Chloroflexota bacterium]|nr:response regulator transcription factor [Chloroflexota bacterium]